MLRSRYSPKDIFRYIIFIAMGAQIALALVWMVLNATAIPSFGDAKEYVNLAKSLDFDEYRPFLYPLIIRITLWIGSRAVIPYQLLLYIFQTLISFASIGTTLRTVRALLRDRVNPEIASSNRLLLLATLYAWTFPMIGFMNFAGMSDSLALSATLLFLSALLNLLFREKPGRAVWVQLLLAFAAGCFLRGDRPFLFAGSGTAMALLLLAFRKIKLSRCLSVISALAVSFAAVLSINYGYQVPGRHGRPKTDLSFVLLDRVVWPHMRECYYDFPLDVRQVVSIYESKKFDAHNNNVMYHFAPMMEEKVGRKRAEELYRIMAKTVFRVRTKRILWEVSHDVVKTCLAPFFQATEVYYVSCHGNGRRCIEPYCYNPRCMAKRTPLLTRILNAGGAHLFVVLFLGAVAWHLRANSLRFTLRRALPPLFVFFGFSMTIALFYGLGDGAHPNSRYSIPVDFAWVVALLLLLSLHAPSAITREVPRTEVLQGEG